MKSSFPLLIIIAGMFICSCKKSPASERPASPNLPVVTTLQASAIQNNSATAGFSISNADTITIIERGIVWGTDSLPSTLLATKISTAEDTSSLSFSITGLTCATKYFARAYAITYTNTIIYGNQVEFTTAETSVYTRQLYLSTTQTTDTTIQSSFVVNMAWPAAGATFISELTLPEGVYMYVKFDSVYHNVMCNNGIISRLVNAGDTMHFSSVNLVGARPGIFVIAQQYVTGMGDIYRDSEAKFSIHIAGRAVTTSTNYQCKYYLGGYGLTNTTYQQIYKHDTTACRPLCSF